MMSRCWVPTLGFLLLAACNAATPPLPHGHLPDTGQPALHAVSDAKLRTLMGRMDSVLFERFMTKPELDRSRRTEALQLGRLANQLGTAVAGILARMPALHLDQDDQAAFKALAAKLQDQAKTLEWQAIHDQTDAIPATLEQMTLTCTSCHELFRKLAQ